MKVLWLTHYLMFFLPDLKMIYNNSDISSFHAKFSNGSRDLTFFIYSKSRSTNCFLAYFEEGTYLCIKDRLTDENISREERVEIMTNNSKTSLCSTGSINSRKSVECHFELEGNGSLVFFPETTKFGEFTIYSLFTQYDSIEELIMKVCVYFSTVLSVFVIVLYGKIFSYCCIRCFCKDKLTTFKNEMNNMHPNVHNDTNHEDIFNVQNQIIVETPPPPNNNNDNDHNPYRVNTLIGLNFDIPYRYDNQVDWPRFFELLDLYRMQNRNEPDRQYIPVLTNCSSTVFSL